MTTKCQWANSLRGYQKNNLCQWDNNINKELQIWVKVAKVPKQEWGETNNS